MSLTFSIPFNGSLKRTFTNYDSDTSIISSNISSSVVNNFVPYHALMSGNLLTAGNVKLLTYSFDVHPSNYSIIKNYESFFNYLIQGSYWYTIAKSSISLKYKARAGQLVEILDNVPIPLVTLVVLKEHVFNINKETPDYSNFFVVISKEFSEGARHTNMYRNFCKYYLEAATKHIDVIYTKDIKNICYKEIPITPIKPKTIAESRIMYRELTYKVLQSLQY